MCVLRKRKRETYQVNKLSRKEVKEFSLFESDVSQCQRTTQPQPLSVTLNKSVKNETLLTVQRFSSCLLYYSPNKLQFPLGYRRVHEWWNLTASRAAILSRLLFTTNENRKKRLEFWNENDFKCWLYLLVRKKRIEQNFCPNCKDR